MLTFIRLREKRKVDKPSYFLDGQMRGCRAQLSTESLYHFGRCKAPNIDKLGFFSRNLFAVSEHRVSRHYTARDSRGLPDAFLAALRRRFCVLIRLPSRS